MTLLRFWQGGIQADSQPVCLAVTANTTILAAARTAGVLVESPCSGAGTCGKCKVRIPAYAAAAIRTTGECRHTLTPAEISQGIHLGCMTEIQGHSADVAAVDIFIPERQNKQAVQILSRGLQLNVALDPLITKQYQPANNQTVILAADAVLGIEPGDTAGKVHGLVVDIGTTTLVAALFDLTTGRELATVSALNPQSLYAQDVLSRIKLGGAAEGLATLHAAIVTAINDMIAELTQTSGTAARTIYEIIFSGNTCMLHLAMNTNPASLGKYPYTPVLRGGSCHPSAALGLNAAPFAQVYLPPVMSAYVGADITAGVLAADLANLPGTTLFVDIGTNGEMALAVNGRLAATSTAAGPAFEGMNIACGMRAAPGAIEKFAIEDEGLIAVKTIAGSPAVGICGSGLLDIVGELVRTGIINKNGKFSGPGSSLSQPLERRLRKENGKTVFTLQQAVYLSQKDIRQVQLAKGAIRAGIECLLAANGLSAAAVDRIFIAGSFGFHLNAASLINIGMLPAPFQGRIRFIGNTAKTGGQALLLNQATRKAAAELVKQVTVLELATYHDFDKTFVNCLNFKEEFFLSNHQTKEEFSCADCHQLNCYRRDKKFPDFCLSVVPRGEADIDVEIEKVRTIYTVEGPDREMALAAAEIEGIYYGRLTRVEEIIAFAKRIGAKKIGIATCIGLIEETRVFTKVLAAKGLESYSVICKVGSLDKTEIGVPPEYKVQQGCHEALCNPILQARLLNQAGTELNVVVGLCVGHDSLFIKHSAAPVTTLITKDRVLGHNPAAALYTSGFYYKRLLQEEKE